MSRKVLVGVLDWGLGHSTRIVPVIQALTSRGFQTVMASSGPALELLRMEFPNSDVRELPSYDIRYPRHGNLLLMVFSQALRVLRRIQQEKATVEAWCREEPFVMIISDHRFGCRSERIRSVFIGHQLSIPVTGFWRLFGWVINRIHWSLIGKFDAVWVPDYPDRRLSGDLSRAGLDNLKFIGPLSRLRIPFNIPEKYYRVVAVISGPDPLRKHFVRKVAGELESLNAPCLLVTGEPGQEFKQVHGKLEIVPHLDAKQLADVMLSADHVLSRSGYTSLMDYATLGINPWLVPTPGQPEQEYLARRLSSMRIAPFQYEADFSLKRFMEEGTDWSGFRPETSGELLDAVLDGEAALNRFQVD